MWDFYGVLPEFGVIVGITRCLELPSFVLFRMNATMPSSL